MKRSLETQIGGDHYKAFAIQPIEFITRNNIPYREGCVIKYVSRHGLKNGAEDIKKAIHILEMILEDYATTEESSEDRTVKDSLTVDIALRNLPEGYTFLGRGPFKLEQGRQWFRGKEWLEKAQIWSSETDILPHTPLIVCTKTKSVIALNKLETQS